jgi:hypothetical protein
MSEFNILNSKSALKNSIFFDKNTNKLSYKDKNGIIKAILDSASESNNNSSELVEFLTLQFGNSDYFSMRKQEGLIDGKSWYSDSNTLDIQYSTILSAWTLVSGGFEAAYINSIDDYPPSGAWTNILNPLETVNVAINVISGTYQEIIELLTIQVVELFDEVNTPEYTETIVNISSAQILSMGTTPIELLPAPGAGKYYDIDKIVLESNGTVAYTIASDAYLYISEGMTFFLDAAILVDYVASGVPLYSIISSRSIEDLTPDGEYRYSYNAINRAVNLEYYTDSGATNPTTGNGTLRVKIYHKTITFGA